MSECKQPLFKTVTFHFSLACFGIQGFWLKKSENQYIFSNVADISDNGAAIVRVSNDVAAATRCTALNWDYTCCTAANPCRLNQGDCDSDDECSGDLRCGLDNCIGFGVTDADCCMVVGIAANAVNVASNAAAISSNAAEIVSISTDVAAATRCTGICSVVGISFVVVGGFFRSLRP